VDNGPPHRPGSQIPVFVCQNGGGPRALAGVVKPRNREAGETQPSTLGLPSYAGSRGYCGILCHVLPRRGRLAKPHQRASLLSIHRRVNRMSFRLVTFGGLRLESDGNVVTGPPAQRRRLAVLALLAANDQSKLTREKAFGYLWPEHSTRRARHLLSESLYVLRRLMGEDVIQSAHDEIMLNPDVLWSDVAAFQDRISSGGGADVVALYRGPFLDGFFLKGAAEFDLWVETLRDRFSRQFAHELESLAEIATEQGDALSATEWWRQLVVHDPFSSRVAGRYMESLATAGERGRAIQFAATHAERLRAELGVDPDPEFYAMLSRLQQSKSQDSSTAYPPRDGGDAVAGQPTMRAPMVSPPPETEEARVPFDEAVAAMQSSAKSHGAGAAASMERVSDAPRADGIGSSARSERRALPRVAITAIGGLGIVTVALLLTALNSVPAPVPVLGAIKALSFEPGIEIGPSFSPDGQYVTYAGGAPLRIYLRQLGSRPIMLVPPDSGPPQARPRWSPDGSRIVYDSGGRIFVVPALGGVPHQVVSDGWSPTWAPDGQRIAYALDDTIFTVDVRGGRPAPLARVIEPAELSWSPDGRWIALSSGNDAWDGLIHIGNIAPSRIVLIGADDGRVVEVTDRSAMNVAPTWSPDSRQLMFISSRAGARDIYVSRLRSDGSPSGEPARISTGLNAHSMALSSNGERIVYATYRGRVNIWSLRIPTGAPVGIADAVPLTTGNQTIESISVSPDRRWIYFTSDRSGNSDIWRLPIQGGEPAQVTRDPADEFAPEQSPDGHWLAFYSMRGGTRDLWIRPLGPGEAVRLTDDRSENHAPHWSPDGTSLCYGQESGSTDYSLRVIRRQGSGWSEPIVPPDEHGVPNRLLGCAGWVPDGRQMVVQDPGRTTIAVFPVEGGPMRVLYSGDPSRGRAQPIWVVVDPHTGAIYFRDWISIWVIEPGSTVPRQIVQFDDPSRRSTRIEMDTDGEHIFFSLGDPQSDLFVAEMSGLDRRSRFDLSRR